MDNILFIYFKIQSAIIYSYILNLKYYWCGWNFILFKKNYIQ